LLFNTYNLIITEEQIQLFFKTSTFSPVKRNEPDLWSKITSQNNILKINTTVDSYLAADIAEFIRQQLLVNGISFTYETVMSHESKIGFMKKARSHGFKVYLYFVATEDPDINVSRVQVRVAQNGHYVDEKTIKNRYYKSLNQVLDATKNSEDAYFWDNSGKGSFLIANVKHGKNITIIDIDTVPNWFSKYILR
jgi:predicted ABC-type ATPase